MNCRSSDPAVGREGWRSESDRWRYCRARTLPHVSFFNSDPTTQNIFRLRLPLANNGVGNPRARVSHLPPLLRRTSRAGQGRGGEGRVRGIVTEPPPCSPLEQMSLSFFDGSAPFLWGLPHCVLLGARNCNSQAG